MENVNLKVLIIGDSGIGKSRLVEEITFSHQTNHLLWYCLCSLLLRFVNDTFDPDQSATIGESLSVVQR